MKGIILAGGPGKCFRPLTEITNKHLLPLYNRPTIYFPIAKPAWTGIKDIILVTGGNNARESLAAYNDAIAFARRMIKKEGSYFDADAK